MEKTAIRIEKLKKRYRLGAIGGGTLRADLQSWWARKRGKEDPNTKIGERIYGKNETLWALNGIDLEIKKGEALGIIGANGAGKSTLLKILSRVTAPTEGDIYINGRIASMLEVGTGFHPEMTGRENIYMNGAILGMTRKEVDAKINDIIEFSECGQFIDTPVKRYSSGMYVKLAFAVTAHLDAEILIMDEVLAVGDVKFQGKCLSKMSDAAEHEGKTILYVSHNMSTIQRLCKRCIVLEKGRVAFDGDVDTAIRMYLNMQIQANTKLNLTKAVRFTAITQKVYMTVLEIVNRDSISVGMDESLDFRLEYELKENMEDMFLKMCVRYQDTTPAGIFLLNHVPGGVKGEKKALYFRLCPRSLAPGEYDFRISLIQLGQGGQEVAQDAVDYVGKINVVQNANDMYGLRWWHSTYGHAYLGEMEKLEEVR